MIGNSSPAKKLVVKFSYPSKWDVEWDVPQSVLKGSPALSGLWNNCHFHVNSDTQACDYWVVYEDIDKYLFETADCPRENTIFVTSEEKTMWSYEPAYLAQFGVIFTSRSDIMHPRVVKGPYLCPWQIKRNYDELKDVKPIAKQADLSVICSDNTYLEGHKKRYALVNRLKGHFKDQLHWFGRGEQTIKDKWDGLAPYRYSVAIENASHRDYFTEKINDCFLAHTMPIYWGCPNIEDYFLADSLIRIDIADYCGTIRTIERAIEENWYEKSFAAIEASRSRVLEQYQFFPLLANLITHLHATDSTGCKGKTLIRSKSFFSSNFTLRQKAYRMKQTVALRLQGYR